MFPTYNYSYCVSVAGNSVLLVIQCCWWFSVAGNSVLLVILTVKHLQWQLLVYMNNTTQYESLFLSGGDLNSGTPSVTSNAIICVNIQLCMKFMCLIDRCSFTTMIVYGGCYINSIIYILTELSTNVSRGGNRVVDSRIFSLHTFPFDPLTIACYQYWIHCSMTTRHIPCILTDYRV